MPCREGTFCDWWCLMPAHQWALYADYRSLQLRLKFFKLTSKIKCLFSEWLRVSLLHFVNLLVLGLADVKANSHQHSKLEISFCSCWLLARKMLWISHWFWNSNKLSLEAFSSLLGDYILTCFKYVWVLGFFTICLLMLWNPLGRVMLIFQGQKLPSSFKQRQNQRTASYSASFNLSTV